MMRKTMGLLACGAGMLAPQAASATTPEDVRLLDDVQRGAFRFFIEKADPQTGLVNDRARNDGPDDYTVASIASTGYGLAALPIGVERGWMAREEAERRARRVLRFVLEKMPHQRGWLYHFVDRRTGERVWNCEVSSIDTGLLVAGALVCGRYFGGGTERLADTLYDRLDWTWMRTNGGVKPGKVLLSHGWKPEEGFLASDWDHYCEMMFLYLLGLGAKRGPLPPQSWMAWRREVIRYGALETLGGGPIFWHQMSHAYYDFRDRRDAAGWDYWVSSVDATRIHRQFCRDRAGERKTYAAEYWGLNASDGPKGYAAYGVPAPEDGTISPTGMLASILFTPEPALASARAMREHAGGKAWGRYGFVNAFNLDAGWYDSDVIGIDLGMALLAIEDHRTGLVWRLMASHPSTARAFAAAGLRKTQETGPRLLRRVF